MIGETTSIEVAFDNIDTADPGFGPFIDVYLPVNGADGATSAPADGISYQTGSASYLGASVVTTILTFPDDGGGTGAVTHPYAEDNTGTPLQVTGVAGDQLLVFELPFGSFTADQPAATISFDVALSNLADLGTALALRSRAGFRYGNDALENPSTDPTTLSQANADATTWLPTHTITPTLLDLQKTYNGPEDETATGPNFARQYRIDVDIADGQTLTDLNIIDELPNNVELLSVVLINPSGTTTNLPVTPANSPDNILSVTIPAVTGTAGATDATLIFDYFIPFRDANGNNVNDEASGDDANSPNTAYANGNWTPIDTRDAPVVATADPAGFEHVLTPKSIATQKSVAIVNDVGGVGYSAGDTIEYNIDFQISDFFALSSLVVRDIMSDGQRFDGTFTPTLSVTEHGTTSSGTFNIANFVIIDNFSGSGAQDGTQEVIFGISDELSTRGQDAIVFGGLVPIGGTGGPDPSTLNFDGGATTGTVTFRAVIQDNFTDDFPSGDPSVDEGDQLSNSVSIDGAVHSYVDASPSGQNEADTSGATFGITSGTLTKTIYAINGSTTLPSPLQLTPGDTITYRLQTTLPSSDVEDLSLEDFLPLPVLFATEVTTFNDTISGTPPSAGNAQFGPSDTFRALYGTTPTLTVNAGSNSVLFDYGDFDDPTNSESAIDILFTVTTSNEPFADGLFLTNQARRTQDTTNASNYTNDAIVQIELAQPELSIAKGIVASDNPNGLFSPVTPGPVSFSAPGTPGFRAAATVTSTGLATNPINSDLSGLDAGDLVTFAIVIQNTGNSRLGAFDVSVRDTLPAGFSVPAAGPGLNLSVTDGTGASMPFSSLGSGLFDPAGGIELTDPGATPTSPDGSDAGALDRFDPTDGRNILLITYDLQVDSDATPLETLNNTATLFNYASTEGGPDFTTENPIDDATATIQPLTVTKTIQSTDRGHTTGNNVAIGEIITYRSTIAVPEGVAESFTWTDTPDSGLAIVDILSVSGSGSISSTNGSFSTIEGNATIAAGGTSMSLDFGDLTNSDTNNGTLETIIIDYRVVVLNSATNDRGDTLNNTASVAWTGGSRTGSAPNVTIVEPTLQVDKVIAPTTGQGNETFTVTIDLSHAAASNADAFDVVLSDSLPTGMNYAGNLSFTGGPVPDSFNVSGNNLSFTYGFLQVGQTASLQFEVTTVAGSVPGSTITNSATSRWTSLPSDVTSPLSSNPLSVERTADTTGPGGAANDYIDTDSATITVTSPTATKSITTTNQSHTSSNNVAIGEIVTYEIDIIIPQGTMPNTTLIDTPDAGLGIVDVLSVGGSSALSTSIGTFADVANNAVIAADGASVAFDFGDLVNSDTNTVSTERITIAYRAIVLNTVGNDNGDTLDNNAVLAWSTSSTSLFDGPDLTIVEPLLNVQVSNATPTTADAGDTVSFTIDLSHDGASAADAFDVNLDNLVNAVANHLQYVPGSVSVTTTGATLTSSSDTGGDLSASWLSFPLGATATITFDALIQNTAPAGAALSDTATVLWTSLPGDVSAAQSPSSLSVERSGSAANAGGTANDHNDSDSGVVNTLPPSASKTIVSTSSTASGLAEHDPLREDVLVGETVTYAILAVLPEGTNTLTITDQLPTGATLMEVVSAQVNSVGSQLTTSSPSIVISDSDTDSVNDRAVISFSNILNTPDGVSNAGDQIEILLTARVLESTGNINAAVLTNSANIDVSGSATVATAEIEIVQPILSIDKATTLPNGPPGTTVPYTVTIEHDAASSASAFDLALNDLFSDPNLSLVPGSVTTDRGTITSGNGASDTTIGLTLDALNRGEVINVSFNALVDPSIAASTTVTNTSAITYDSLPGPGGGSTSLDDSEVFTTTTPVADIAITIDDNIDPAAISGPLTYTIVVTNNGPSTATNVLLNDPMAAGVSSVAATTNRGSVNATDTLVSGNLGTLLPGETATIIINLIVPPTPGSISTTASVTLDQTDSAPANNSDTEPTLIVALSSLAGRSWVDSNSDNIVDPGETLLPGVEVSLIGTDDLGASVFRTTTTDASGNYIFDLIRPGDYEVLQAQPTLFADNADYLGSAGGVVTNDMFALSIGTATSATDYNFTESGLNALHLGKRALLNSSLQAIALGTMTFELFQSIMVPRGQADLNTDNVVDNADYVIFLGILGSPF